MAYGNPSKPTNGQDRERTLDPLRAQRRGPASSSVPPGTLEVEAPAAARKGTAGDPVRFRETVLVIEDEPDAAEVLQYNLEREGYHVLLACDGPSGLACARAERPEVVLLDVMLPGMDGIEVARALRSDPETRGIAIIMVSARGEESDVILGLGIGADDYIVKPFGIKEIVARIKAVLRRSRVEPSPPAGKIRRGGLVIDTERFHVAVDGAEVHLTLTEFRLLSTLAWKPGIVFTRARLLESIATDQYVDERNIDVHVTSLRKKLGAYRNSIVTVRGVGYKFSDASAE
jgi:DNA-binding response OmpR family regulator